MFFSFKVRDGELLFLRNNRIIGFVKSDEIPSTVSSGTASDTSRVLFKNAAKGSAKPDWIERIPDAQAFGVVRGDFRTVFIVPDGSAQSLIPFQGPTGDSGSVRLMVRRFPSRLNHGSPCTTRVLLRLSSNNVRQPTSDH